MLLWDVAPRRGEKSGGRERGANSAVARCNSCGSPELPQSVGETTHDYLANSVSPGPQRRRRTSMNQRMNQRMWPQPSICGCCSSSRQIGQVGAWPLPSSWTLPLSAAVVGADIKAPRLVRHVARCPPSDCSTDGSVRVRIPPLEGRRRAVPVLQTNLCRNNLNPARLRGSVWLPTGRACCPSSILTPVQAFFPGSRP